MPVVKGDKVKILRGTYKGKEGKVTEVYRKKWVIHVEGINRDKVNGSSAKVGIDASKVEIIELKLSKETDPARRWALMLPRWRSSSSS